MTLRSKARYTSCTVSGWRSALLTLRRSGHVSISISLEHFLFQEGAGHVVDSKQEWACWQHTSAKYRVCQQCLWVFLRQLVVGVWKNHPHVSVDEKHRRLEEFHCTVCSSLQLHREQWTYLCSVATYLTELEDYDSLYHLLVRVTFSLRFPPV